MFFENYSVANDILKKNLSLIKNLNNFEIYEKDFLNFFQSYKNLNTKFDLIFIDPPYREIRINEIIEIILDQKMLDKNGVLIIHRHKKDNITITNKIKILEERTYGISKVLFGN